MGQFSSSNHEQKRSYKIIGIQDSTLSCSNLAVKTQLHQLLLSTLKHLFNNNCGVVVDTEKYVTHGNYYFNKF